MKMRKLKENICKQAVAIAGVIVLGLMLAVAPALAAEEKTIESIDNNNVVTMDDGSRYQADDNAVQSWHNGNSVIVPESGDKLINKDENNEEVDADER